MKTAKKKELKTKIAKIIDKMHYEYEPEYIAEHIITSIKESFEEINKTDETIEKGRVFKKGDVVKVYSLQSFFHGGFLRGVKGIVYQDQQGEDGSVLVSVKRQIDGVLKLDPSYEVYPEQLRFIHEKPWRKSILDKFDALLNEIEELEGKDE